MDKRVRGEGGRCQVKPVAGAKAETAKQRTERGNTESFFLFAASAIFAQMIRPPLILISPNIEKKGDEFGDLSISLSETYQMALMGVGAIPMTMPATASRELVAECVRRADGVLLTGGEDVEPSLYAKKVPAKLRRTVRVTPDGGARDLREFMLVDEVFRQRKPLL